MTCITCCHSLSRLCFSHFLLYCTSYSWQAPATWLSWSKVYRECPTWILSKATLSSRYSWPRQSIWALSLRCVKALCPCNGKRVHEKCASLSNFLFSCAQVKKYCQNNNVFRFKRSTGGIVPSAVAHRRNMVTPLLHKPELKTCMSSFF